MGKRGGNFFFQGSRHRSLIFFPFWSRSRTPGLSFKFYTYLFGDYIIQDKESMHKNFIQNGLPPYLASHSRTHKHNSGLVLQLQILVHELWSYKSEKREKRKWANDSYKKCFDERAFTRVCKWCTDSSSQSKLHQNLKQWENWEQIRPHWPALLRSSCLRALL